MAGKQNNRLAIEFFENEIRVLDYRAKGNDLSVSYAGSIAMEPAYLDRGVIVAPELVGVRLRALLAQNGLSGSEVVVCYPTEAAVSRVLNLPSAPDNELRAMVNGEVEHYGLARNGGAYDYLRLHSASKDAEGVSILLMACDGMVIHSIENVLNHAGLHLSAVEPTHVALVRAGATLAQTPERALYLTLSESRTDMSVSGEGEMAFYRSFEYGTKDLFRGPTESMFPESDTELPEGATTLHPDVANSLAVEIRRSVDYFSREFPDLPGIDHIVLASNNSSADLVAAWLRDDLGVGVDCIRTSGVDGLSDAPDPHRFLTCYGLAIRDEAELPENLPRMNLVRQEQMVSRLAVADRNARLAVIGMAAVLIAALIGAVLMTLRVSQANRDLIRAEENLQQAQRVDLIRKREDERRASRYAMLRANGLPVNGTILTISRSLPANTGLTDIRMTPGRTEVSGEAVREEDLTALMTSLRMRPSVVGVSLTSFERIESEGKSKGMTFKMTVSSPMAMPPPAPVPAGGAR